MTDWDAANTFCPFYVTEQSRDLVCESLIKGVRCVHQFQREATKRKYKTAYCNTTNCAKCRYYIALCEIYSQEG